MTTIPVWTPPPPRPPAPLPRRVDVAVVGGGITGVCAARFLAERGVSVTVLERGRLASGASGRNAGFCLAGVAESYVAAVRRHGRRVAREVWDLTARNHDHLLVLGGGTLPGHRRLGSFVVAGSPGEGAELEESAQLLAEDGVAAGWEARAAGAPFGRLHVPGDGELDPAAAVATIAGRLPAGRAAVIEGVDVDVVEQRGGSVHLSTGGGEVTAGAVLLAVNASTARLAPEVPIRPVRAQMLATTAVAASVAALPTYARRGFDYWRRLPDGRLLAGGRRDVAVEGEVGEEDATTVAVQDSLDLLCAELGAGDARVTHRWSGAMGFSPDGLPIVGVLPGSPRIAVCGGYTGHGLGFAAECAGFAVSLLLEAVPPPAHLALSRFTSAPPAGPPGGAPGRGGFAPPSGPAQRDETGSGSGR